MDSSFPIENPNELLRSVGLRATPQRISIAKLLFGEAIHLTPQQIFEKLKPGFPSMSQNTVYLTLAHFEASGLLRRIHADGRTIFDSNTEPHDHAYCRQCGDIIDIPLLQTDKTPKALDAWNIHGESRTWMGYCPPCSTESQ